MIDLHTHTTASDGTLSPKKLVELAITKNLKALAITDHDVIDGIKEAKEFSKDKDIEIIPGIEIACYEPEHGFSEVHILGLLINYNNPHLIDFTKKIQEERINQKKKIINKLKELGFDISFEEVLKEVGSSFGRPHIAKVLIKKYPHEFSSIQETFTKYLGYGKPAYFDRSYTVSIKEAIDLIKKSEGISFLAHPGVYKKEDSLKLIELFQNSGGEGIETHYPYYLICPDLKINEEQNNKMIEFYKKIAKSKNMLESGGSDFHGSDRNTIHKINIPDSLLTTMKKYLEKTIKH